MSHHTEALVAVAALIVWSVYRRVRRTLRWQPLVKRRLAVRGSLFVVIGVLLLVSTLYHPAIAWWDAAGVAAGAALAWVALRNTRYERREDGWYYRPHGAIGALVILLFLARLAYRLAAAKALWNGLGTAAGGPVPAGGAHSSAAAAYTADPWTAGAMFVLVAYYALYFLVMAKRGPRPDEDTETG
ncbi:CcdC protein domain-containing protein [Alicyclobacillus macrosporangiidus]|uniref:CcdC protein domain-containing protein n=1 Tax=Alicyclobacillus macrosporangiidus TaxID=392015 RepID=UPI0004970112|nr:CcdC protein domain-containing protein [Alicyclobacillus macrosporangiidus]